MEFSLDCTRYVGLKLFGPPRSLQSSGTLDGGCLWPNGCAEIRSISGRPCGRGLTWKAITEASSLDQKLLLLRLEFILG